MLKYYTLNLYFILLGRHNIPTTQFLRNKHLNIYTKHSNTIILKLKLPEGEYHPVLRN